MGEIPFKGLTPLVTIHPWSLESVGAGILSSGGVALKDTTSAVWPAASGAFLVPFVLSVPFTVVKMFTYNGAVVNDNLDVGIYFNEGGSSTLLRRIVSKGSTAQAGTNQIQELDIVDTQLAPGMYYMVLAAVNNTTATFFRSLINWAALRGIGTRSVSLGGWPLGDPLDFVDNTYGYMPVFGLTGRTVV